VKATSERISESMGRHLPYGSTTAFAAAGPVLWNSLPSHLKEADLTYSQFRRSLKTFLFG